MAYFTGLPIYAPLKCLCPRARGYALAYWARVNFLRLYVARIFMSRLLSWLFLGGLAPPAFKYGPARQLYLALGSTN